MAAGCCGCLRPRVDAVVHFSTQVRPRIMTHRNVMAHMPGLSGSIPCAHAKMRYSTSYQRCSPRGLLAEAWRMWCRRVLLFLHALGCVYCQWSADSGQHGARQVDRSVKAVVRLESEILAERARVLADPRPASYFALFKCAKSWLAGTAAPEDVTGVGRLWTLLHVVAHVILLFHLRGCWLAWSLFWLRL